VSKSGFFAFPHPVNETSARVVAAGVVCMAAAAVVADQPWIMIPLAYGFAARVAAGPKLSPLGLVATRVVTPRLDVEHRYSPGPPKRLAQAMGLAMSATALALHYRARRPRAAQAVLAALATAAGLEAAFGLCLGCKLFEAGMRAGLVPETVCEDCRDIWNRGREPLETSGRTGISTPILTGNGPESPGGNPLSRRPRKISASTVGA
jgi:hypothetical protein